MSSIYSFLYAHNYFTTHQFVFLLLKLSNPEELCVPFGLMKSSRSYLKNYS